MDHFHIPLQSGCDEILSSMRRKYTVQEYRDVIQKIKEYFPNAGIGADIIVGYPGETEQQFMETCQLIEEIPITHFHVFPYSKRKRTLAAMNSDQIQYSEKKRRAKILRELGRKKLLEFSKKQIGTTNKVLFEKQNDNGLWEGYTTNYLRVFMKSDVCLKIQFTVFIFNLFKTINCIAHLLIEIYLYLKIESHFSRDHRRESLLYIQ